MANNPLFESKPRYGRASLSAAVTTRDGTSASTVITGVASPGTKIDRIVIKSTGQPAATASVVCLYYFDGTNKDLFDEIVIPASQAAGSTAVAAYRTERAYKDLVLADASSQILAHVTVAPLGGAILVEAFGGDLT